MVVARVGTEVAIEVEVQNTLLIGALVSLGKANESLKAFIPATNDDQFPRFFCLWHVDEETHP